MIFDKALKHTLEFEGGYVDDPDDPGGATNCGISLRFLILTGKIEPYDFDNDGDITPVDIKNLSKNQIATLYREYFWNPLYEELPERLAIKLFDLSVNMGTKQATLLLQRVLGCRPYDGIYGPKTHRFATHTNKEVCTELVNSAARFYFNLADKRKASRKYLYGWLRRCYS
jgi:lysozyme family protein